MKRIGETDTGDIIICMSRDEVSAFDSLAYAVEGKNMWDVDFPARLVTYPDLSSVFNAIRHYAITLGAINKLIDQATGCRELMLRPNER